MRAHTYPSVSIGHAPRPQELTWWAAAAATAAIAASIGIAASLYLAPAAAAALAPQIGFAGAHFVLAAIYGLATLVVLSVLRLAGTR